MAFDKQISINFQNIQNCHVSLQTQSNGYHNKMQLKVAKGWERSRGILDSSIMMLSYKSIVSKLKFHQWIYNWKFGSKGHLCDCIWTTACRHIPHYRRDVLNKLEMLRKSATKMVEGFEVGWWHFCCWVSEFLRWTLIITWGTWEQKQEQTRSHTADAVLYRESSGQPTITGHSWFEFLPSWKKLSWQAKR